MSSDSNTPMEFGKYRLLKKIAQGGMAEIFLAVQVGLHGFEKVVVIKRVLADLCESDEFVGMFLDEARLAARLDHSNIVRIYDFGEINGQYYLSMEYLAGEDLASILQQCKRTKTFVPVELFAEIMIGAAEGLHFAHEMVDARGNSLNIVHRDVSPSNILVTYQGAVKLVDFGIARAESNVSKTNAGQLKGKYQYLSPEQIQGKSVDRRADIFALGIVMHEMLTVQRLFKRDSHLATVNAILEDDIRLPSAIRPDVPGKIDQVVSKALARDPSERYQSAANIAADLSLFLSNRNYVRTGKLQSFLQGLFGEERKQKKLRIAQGAEIGGSEAAPRPAVPGRGVPSLSDLSPIRSDPRVPSVAADPAKAAVPPIPAGEAPTNPGSPVQLPPPPPPRKVSHAALPAVKPPPGKAVQLKPPPSPVPTRNLPVEIPKTRFQISVKTGVIAVLLVFGVGLFAIALGRGRAGGDEQDAGGPPGDPPTPPNPSGPSSPPGPPGPPDPPDPPPAPPGLQVGELSFKGLPEGAKVKIDDVLVANPSVPEYKPKGSHKIQVDAPNYLSKEWTVELATGQRLVVNVELQPRPKEAKGKVQIACQPWCQISVDGKDTGKTSPADLSLPAGRHELTLTNDPAGLQKKIRIEVVAGTTQTKVVNLEE